MNRCDKISIIGNSGAGKSTLGRKIGEKLNIEVFTIDKIYWLPGWKLREHCSYKELHDSWISKNQWIIDGIGYWDELVIRLNMSDLVIYYDVPVSICVQRAENRIKNEKKEVNRDIIEGCFYGRVRDLQMKVIENFEIELKPKILQLIKGLDSTVVQIISNGKELKL